MGHTLSAVCHDFAKKMKKFILMKTLKDNSKYYRIVTVLYMVVLAWLQLKDLSQSSGKGVHSVSQLLHNLAHIPAYAILTFLLLRSVENINLKTKLTSFAIAFIYGIFMEICQSLNPQRFASFGDICLNTVGIFLIIYLQDKVRLKA